MGNSVLVFVSHSSEDKGDYIEPIVQDLEECYINVWFDKRKILPGDNLRKSIFRDGIDKADIALIFFTEQSLQSSWVDSEIKHVLREEKKKGNNFDLNKIISIFDSKETYKEISKRYPELTDDLLHLMPKKYSRKDLGQLISAIWSKHLDLQGGDVETQRQLLAKEKEIFQKEKDIQDLKIKLQDAKSKNSKSTLESEFQGFLDSGKVNEFISQRDHLLTEFAIKTRDVLNASEAMAFGLLEYHNSQLVKLSNKGKDFLKWYMLREN
ncbi:hypothetical protein MNBD_GAMMA04-630 [hydrothermal vent metagenome]|uniref:TIR domain-containing protein n=1 Tax=hydrothermal vent metagenome TaxID=652676 RepID=A0A3B0W3P4_9ZZZZ